MRPAVHPTTELIYDSLGDGLIGADESTGWQLLLFLDDVIAESLGAVDDIVRDSDEGPGWSGVLDPDRVDADHIWWLGQLVGAREPRGAALTLEQAQARLTDAEGWKRGTLAALKAGAATHLTGSKKVIVNERDGSAYQLTVQTYAVQTPDETLTEADIRKQKPAGIVLTYEVLVGEDWQAVKDNFATWQDVKDNFATWNDLLDWVAP